jgi:hypothetical protein
VEKKHDLCVLPYRLRRVESSKEKKTILLQPTSTKWVWTKRFCGTRIIENKKKNFLRFFRSLANVSTETKIKKSSELQNKILIFLEKQD